MISAIIFASGYSKRLKQNKLLTEIEGKPLLERIIQQVILSQVDEIILVYREAEIMRIGEKYNLNCILNKNAERGISELLKLGVQASSSETDAYMFFVFYIAVATDNNYLYRCIQFKKRMNWSKLPIHSFT